MNVRVARVMQEAELVLDNMMQLYIHDFSAFWSGTPQGDLEPDGRFTSYPLASYWTEPSRYAYLLWRDDILAGFALVNDHAHSGRPVDASMAEFFVLRKHRGSGLAAQAAQLVFAGHPGQWEVAVARKNTNAIGFWRKTIAAIPGARDIAETDHQDADWNGPIMRFELG